MKCGEYVHETMGECWKILERNKVKLAHLEAELWSTATALLRIEKEIAKRDASNGVDAEKRKLIGAYRLVSEDFRMRKLFYEPICSTILDIIRQLESELEASDA
jgi:hypothetical protein